MSDVEEKVADIIVTQLDVPRDTTHSTLISSASWRRQCWRLSGSGWLPDFNAASHASPFRLLWRPVAVCLAAAAK